MRRLKKYLVALVLPLAGAALAIALAPLAPEGKRLLSPLGQFFGPREAWAQEESTPKQETDPEAPLAQGDGSVTEIPLELDKPSPGQGEGEGVGEDLAGGGLGVEAPEAATLPLLAPPGGEPTLVMAVPSTGHWASFGSEAMLGASLALKAIGGGFELKAIDEAATDFPNYLRSLGTPVAIMGHLYESRLSQGAPYYAKSGAPVLLTYVESAQASELGPGFVRLLPNPASQGRRIAKDVPRTGKKIKQVYILEGPDPAQKELAEAFRESLVNPTAPAPTKANPKPSKPRALKASSVNTIPINSPGDLKVIMGLKGSPQDWVLVALPPWLAMRAGRVLAESEFKRANILLPTSLAIRDLGASYIAMGLKYAQVALPLEIGSGKNANKALAEFQRRFVQSFRREPSWAAVLAYDATTLASLAAHSAEGSRPFLEDAEMTHIGAAGRLTLGEDGWPVSMVKLDSERLHWLP